MNTKLTLRLDDELIQSAKRFSSEHGKSVSQLVADYFALIEAGAASKETEPTPRVRSLLGALAGGTISEQDWRRHVEAKHK